MRYYQDCKDHLDVKLITFFLVCLIIGAILAMEIKLPGEEQVIRNVKTRTLLRSRRIEETEENE